ncbi:unnamed protein product [Prunus armeniaca]
MSSPKTRAQSSSSPVPPDYITRTGVDSHAIEVRSKLHPFAQKNLDENILHLFKNTLVLGPHWFGPVLAEMAELMKKDAEAPLCFESTSALSSHSWVSKNLSRSFPSSEVRNNPVKWADWIDRLLPRYGAHWRRAGIYDAILLSKQSINKDENLLAAALCFWNSASNTFNFRIGPMAPTLLDMAQIFGFRPHGRHVDVVGDYHRRKNQEKLSKPFTISPASINQNCSFSNYHGGGKPPNYHLGAEVYHPNFCARQLGCPQLIPLKSYRSCNRATSWRDVDDLEVHKDARLDFEIYLPPVLHSKSSLMARIPGLFTQERRLTNPSLTKNIGGQSVQSGKVIVTSVIDAGDLELPSRDEDEILSEQPPVEATPFPRTLLLKLRFRSPPLPLTKSKRLRKRTRVESDETKKPAVVPTETSGTDDELREAFKAVEQEKKLEEPEEVEEGPQGEAKIVEEEEEIPTEVIAESIALAQKQQENTRAELTSLELTFFEDAEVEHSTAVSATEEQAEQSASEPVEQAEQMIAFPETVVKVAASVPDFAMAEFEAMDLDAQLDRLEKLNSTPGKAKSKAVEEAVERLKIWQSTELELDEDREAIDQLMKDLDLLHKQNMAPKPILEMSLGLARDVLNLHDHYEDLKPTFKTSEFCKAIHEANLVDYAKQKEELDQMVAGYKEAKGTVDKLERKIEELQKQLAECREVQNRLGAGLSSKTKATFLVQSMVAASRPALEIAEASIHQGVLLQKELSIKKANLQETLRKLGF